MDVARIIGLLLYTPFDFESAAGFVVWQPTQSAQPMNAKNMKQRRATAI
jgi:hypothetical protein